MTAVVLLIVVDTTASALDLLTFNSTNTINVLWLASYAFWGASALTPSMYALSEPTTSKDIRFTRKRLIALSVAVLVAPATLITQHLRGGAVDLWAIAITSVAMFVLVVARMNLSIDQIQTANRQVAEAQQALRHQASHDALTGLPNRRQAVELITAALARTHRTGDLIGLLFIDLDGFKRVNDTLGHSAGDELLRIVAHRMQGCVRGGDVVARLGGDEFLVLLEPIEEQDSAVAVAERILDALSLPTTLTGSREVVVGASIGVAVSHDATADPDTLMHEADVAVYRAKNSGRSRVEVFDRAMRAELQVRADLQADLSAAIVQDELVLHYQPIVDIGSGDVQGYEALVRWVRPDKSIIPPSEFIGLAEQSDLICDLDAWVLRTATRQLAEWNRITSSRDLLLAVNVSARHVARRRIIDDVMEAVGYSDIASGQLILEITETALIDDPLALTNLDRLHRDGINISIDDFGTGYSSISRLEQLPIDIIKIDRRFLDHTTKSAEKLLPLIVQTAHALDLAVIAEGVENEAQLQLLQSLHCQSAQGFYLGRPVEAAEIIPTDSPRSGLLRHASVVELQELPS